MTASYFVLERIREHTESLIEELKDYQKENPNREVALAITNLEQSLMWTERHMLNYRSNEIVV